MRLRRTWALGLVLAGALAAPGAAPPDLKTAKAEAEHDVLFQADGFATPGPPADPDAPLEVLAWSDGQGEDDGPEPLDGLSHSWNLGHDGDMDLIGRRDASGMVLVKGLLWTPDNHVLRADLPVAVGGQGVLQFAGGRRVHVAVRLAGDTTSTAAEIAFAKPEVIDIAALMGRLTTLKPNKTVLNYKLPKLSAGEVDRYWATSGLPRPSDPRAAYARAYMRYLDNTSYQGKPGGLRSHIPDGVLIDTLGSVAIAPGIGKVFGNTATRNGGTMQIGPELEGGKNYYSSFTRYDMGNDGYITINKVVVVDDQAVLMTGLKVRPNAMTTVKLAGDILISVYPVVRREGEPDFNGIPVVDGNTRDGLPPLL